MGLADPILLTAHDPAWTDSFEVCRAALMPLFASEICHIEHVGSTSIPGISAKPILDIMLGVASVEVIEDRIDALEAEGWQYVPEYEDALPERRYFRRPDHRPRTHHLHCEIFGSPGWNGRIAFRDRLRADPGLASDYERLKRRLARECAGDPGGYQEGKGPFIDAVVRAAGVDLPG